jgi:glyoxylase-like metal-dependent hydrolase (beta-lactamase superfamily II)/outer membrane protein OmpA-like peptidoglycan-associated protein
LRLSFHGADRDVTGSCHLVECAGRRILIDCGLYQGSREIAEENAGDFGFDPAGIDVVLLTHAHLDHCGRLPLLTRRGFRGEIIATAPTRELARLVMLDAAHLQEEETRSNSHRPRHGADDPAEPLFTVADALKSLESFKRSVGYGEPTDLAPGIRATFVDAGHILGSASILLELTEGGRSLRLLLSGDLGNAAHPLLLAPPPPPPADVVVIETTYGDRLHQPMEASIYLLLVTSLIANFVLATLALRSVKQSEITTAGPQESQIKTLQAAVGQLKRERDRLAQRNETLETAVTQAQSEQGQAESKIKQLEALKSLPQDQPPIITLREADGFSFPPGSADVSPEFLARLPGVVRKLAALSERYGAQIVEVIGHTDGTSIRDTLRVKANLDDALGQYLDPASTTALFPFDNVGLGISRSVSVARALRTSGLPPNLDIQPLSAAYLIAPNDRTDPADRRLGDASRRRIEIRIRRVNAN